jgi:Amt family ammonium transporter
MDTAATIPTGSGAERIKFGAFVIMSFWVSMLIYPIVGNWVWGGGFLANLGRTLGFGNGAVDFAGSGPVHTTGGAIGLAIAMALGPRIGKFNKDGSANAIPGHNIPLGILGTIILFFGWFGFNPGSALGVAVAPADATGVLATWPMNLVSIAAVNTLLAGAAGGMSSMFYMWFFGPARKPDPSMSVNGLLAGLVAVTAPCAFVNPIGAVIIGLVGGVLVCIAAATLEKLQIDDPVGAVPVHLVNGIWGVIAVGIFAVGNPDTAAWNGIDSPVTGLLYGGGTQILAQLFEAVSIALFAFIPTFIFFKVLMGMGLLRSRAEDEVRGLDVPEMGTPGYVGDGNMISGSPSLPTPMPVGSMSSASSRSTAGATAGD